MAMDFEKNGQCSIIRFEREANNVGIHLSEKDIQILLQVYRLVQSDPNCLDVSYEAALKSIVPILSKNFD
jgi:hypothetical protein